MSLEWFLHLRQGFRGMFTQTRADRRGWEWDTHHLVLGPDGHHSAGDGGDDGTHRVPLWRSGVNRGASGVKGISNSQLNHLSDTIFLVVYFILPVWMPLCLYCASWINQKLKHERFSMKHFG